MGIIERIEKDLNITITHLDNTRLIGVEITPEQHIQNMKPFFALDQEGEKEWLYPGEKE